MVIGNAGKWLRAQWHNILLKFEASILRPLAMLGNGYELNGITYFLRSLSYWLSAHSSSSRSSMLVHFPILIEASMLVHSAK